MKAIDITGQRFSRLVAIEFAYKKGKTHLWVFQCDCGTKKTIIKASVTSGLTTSCGCYNREITSKQQIDITGQRFGRLTAIEFSHKEGRRHYWVFMCDCGTKKAILKASVMNNRTTSCGCYNREKTSKMVVKDISNQRYDMLVAIEAIGKDRHGLVLWRCQCDCGNTSIVRGIALRAGAIKSCGCWNRTKKAGKNGKKQKSY